MEILNIRKIEKISKTGNNYTRELCTIKCPICNNIYERSFRNLKENTKCRDCSQLINNKNKIGNGHKTIGELSGSYINSLKQQAKQRGKKFEVSTEYLWNLFLKQNRKCALSGIELNIYTYSIWTSTGKSRHHNTSIMSASLDRINSNEDYIEGNVQWVHKIVNIMKNTLSTDEFLYFCEQIYLNNEKDNFEPSFIKDNINNNIIMKKVQRLTGEPNNNPDTSTPQPNGLG